MKAQLLLVICVKNICLLLFESDFCNYGVKLRTIPDWSFSDLTTTKLKNDRSHHWQLQQKMHVVKIQKYIQIFYKMKIGKEICVIVLYCLIL